MVKREIGPFGRHDFLGHRRQRRQDLPHRVEDPALGMPELVENLLCPGFACEGIGGLHRVGHSPNMLTGMIKIENFDPRLTGHA